MRVCHWLCQCFRPEEEGKKAKKATRAGSEVGKKELGLKNSLEIRPRDKA